MVTCKKIVVWLAKNPSFSSAMCLLLPFVLLISIAIYSDRGTLMTVERLMNSQSHHLTFLWMVVGVGTLTALIPFVFITYKGEYWEYAVDSIWSKKIDALQKKFPGNDERIFMYVKTLSIKKRKEWLKLWSIYERCTETAVLQVSRRDTYKKEIEKLEEMNMATNAQIDILRSKLILFVE